MIEYLANLKDALASLQSIATMLALVIGAIWALRRFGFERPYESVLDLKTAATMVRLGNEANFLHVEVDIENIGKSAIVIGDSANAKSVVTILGINEAGWEKVSRTGIVDPKDANIQTQITCLFDGGFTEIFKQWFEKPWPSGYAQATLEVGEPEHYSAQLIVPKGVVGIFFLVKIYEAVIRNRELGRPYYWLIEKLIECKSTPANATR